MATTDHSALRASWGWLVALGIISLVGGFLALINPFAATLAAVFLAGWTFLILGVLQIVQAFRVRGWGGFLWALLFGILTLAVGFVLLLDPLAGTFSLTFVVAIIFLFTGVVKAFYAFSVRPTSGWGWALLSAVISVVLGVLILANFPVAAVTVLGVLLAVELISNGVLFLLLGLGMRGSR